MRIHPLLLITSLAASVLLSTTACSVFRADTGYNKAVEQRPLEVPPELDQPVVNQGMAVPGERSNNVTGMSSLGSSNFMMDEGVSSAWDRIGNALNSMEGITIKNQSRMLSMFSVQQAGSTVLIRVTSKGADSTLVEAINSEAKPVDTPQTRALIGKLKQQLGVS